MKLLALATIGLVAAQNGRFANLHIHPSPTNPAIPPSFAVQSPLNNPTYPPSAWFDINNVTTIALLAQASIQRMQTWYTAGQYQWTAWWQIPVLGMAYADLDIALGNQGNKFLVTDLLVKNSGQNYMIDKYIDDQSWWAMFALRGYQAYGNETWLESVKIISANNTLYTDDTCGGGVLWLTYRPLIKNTITNSLYFSVLARLYRFTGDESYYYEAIKTLDWWLGWGIETDTGRVYDTLTAPRCYTNGLQGFSYNSGAILFGLADLYYATLNTTLLDLGRSIAYAAMRDFTDPETGVLVEKCENDPQPEPDLPPGCQQDEIVFKGILVLGMAEFYVARPDQNIYNFINTQMLSVVWNNIDKTWLMGEWWQQFNETTAGPKTQICAIALIAAAATVNVDFLAKAGKVSTVQNSSTGSVSVPTNITAGGTGSSVGHGNVAAAGTTRIRIGREIIITSILVGLGFVIIAI